LHFLTSTQRFVLSSSCFVHLLYKRPNHEKDFFKFCVLLRKSELYPKIDYDSWLLFTFGCNGGGWVSLGGPGWWLDLTFVIVMNNLIIVRLWIWNLWIRCRMDWSGPDIGSRTNSWRWSSAVLALASQIIFEMVCVLKLFITNPAKIIKWISLERKLISLQ
jgi:hypothetical protein